MRKAVQSWSWLRVLAVMQGIAVTYAYVFMGRSAQDSTFWLVAAIFLWLMGETKPEIEAIYMPLERKEE